MLFCKRNLFTKANIFLTKNTVFFLAALIGYDSLSEPMLLFLFLSVRDSEVMCKQKPLKRGRAKSYVLFEESVKVKRTHFCFILCLLFTGKKEFRL